MEKLEDFRVAKYRFVLKPLEFIKLATFAGSSLRRDFLPIFKQITCLKPDETCSTCERKDECVYFDLIEDQKGYEDPIYHRFQTPPKPFIFEPPLKRKTSYHPTEKLTYDLLLIGRAIEYFPYFLATIRQLGEVGMGRNHGKFEVEKIIAFDLMKNSIAAEYAFNSETQSFDNEVSVSLKDLYQKYLNEYEEIRDIVVSLITPLRMKRIGSENWHLHFRNLIRNILTRLANLAYTYCGYDEFLDFPEIIYKAGRVRTVKENYIWEDWRHPAKRQDDSIRLGGFIGDIHYHGDITEFWGILRLGELLHIGKNTSFGLGRILVEPDERTSKMAQT